MARANKYISSDIARVNTLPPTSQLGEWVNKVIGILVSPLPTLPVPLNGVSEDIQYIIKQLEQAYILGTNVVRHSSDSSWLNVQQPVIDVLDIQKSVTPS